MIKLDYEIIRDKGNGEVEKFGPSLFLDNDNIPLLTEISAPNSSGKTTFQQLIAISFQVQRSKSIDESIRNKANRLFASHQKLKFEIIIDNPHFDKIIRICKKDETHKEIEFQEISKSNKNKIENLTDITVDKKYELIYDIPNDPLGRLNKIVDDLTTYQELLVNRMPNINQQFKNIINIINKTPNKTEIKKLKEKIESLKKTEKRKEEEIKKLKIKEKDFLIYRDLSKHYYNNLKFEEISKIISDLRNDLKKIGPEPKVSVSDKNSIKQSVLLQKESINKSLENFFQYIENNFFVSDDNDKDELVRAFNSVDYDDFLNNQFEATNFYSFIKKIRTYVSQYKIKLSDNTDYKLVKLIQALGSVLRNYEDSVTSLPGFNKTPKEIIKSFEQILTKFEDFQHITEAIEIYDIKEAEVRQPAKQLFGFILKNRKILTAETGGLGNTKHKEINSKIDSKKEELKKIKNERKTIEYTLIANGVKKDNFSSERRKMRSKYKNWPREYQKLQYINPTENLTEEKDILIKTKQNIQLQENKLFQLKNTERSKHIKYKEEIIEYSDAALNLEVAFKKFNRYGKMLKSRDSNIDKDSDGYFKMTETYLAEKLETLVHDGSHKLTRVDFLNELFYTAGNRKIHFNDLGSGQGAANYLVGMLKKQYSNPIVVLFDETAHMDRNSLKIVYNQLKKLYDSKKLLCAIVVKPTDGDSSIINILDLL